MGATKKVAKQVTVIARYAHKTQGKINGIVTYAVRSSNGKEIYCSTLINGKASGCSCKSFKPCYHMTQLEQKELERKATAEVVAIAEPIIEMPTQGVVVATPVAVQKYQMAKGVREKLAAIAKPVEVVVETPVVEEPVKLERTYYWCPNRCCYKWSDSNKVCEPQPDGKIWNSDICEWITPPSGEPIDHQAELAAAGWYAAGRQVKDTAKAAMRVEIAEIRERSMMNATLTTNQGFQLMR